MTKIIQCTQGIKAIVDDEDYEWLSKYTWSIVSGYPRRRSKNSEPDGGGKSILMHRMIMQPLDGYEVDHINGIRHDNRRENLRLCTSYDNDCNKRKIKGVSKHKGVYFCKNSLKWYAEIKVHSKRIRLGCYDTEDEAGKAYNDAAKIHHGEYARLNIVDENIIPVRRIQTKSMRKNNTSGHIGVYKREYGKWRAIAKHNGRNVNLGSYNSIDEAINARNKYVEENAL